MAALTTALVTFASGDVYRRFAADLMQDAETLFRPTENVRRITLQSVLGWPHATMMRPMLLTKWLLTLDSKGVDFVFMVDADARIENEVGPEILPPDGKGITATLHPGYVDKPEHELPYERDPASSCFVEPGAGKAYYCGGFLGGDVESMYGLMYWVYELIDHDLDRGRVPQWHDESALNRALNELPPQRVLTPAYCHPDDDTHYVQSVWSEHYERKIVALDKTPSERGRR